MLATRCSKVEKESFGPLEGTEAHMTYMRGRSPFIPSCIPCVEQIGIYPTNKPLVMLKIWIIAWGWDEKDSIILSNPWSGNLLWWQRDTVKLMIILSLDPRCRRHYFSLVFLFPKVLISEGQNCLFKIG